jgi:hypothetical protein
LSSSKGPSSDCDETVGVDAHWLGCPDRPRLKVNFWSVRMLERRGQGRVAMVFIDAPPGEFGTSNSLATGTRTNRWLLCSWDGAPAPRLVPNRPSFEFQASTPQRLQCSGFLLGLEGVDAATMLSGVLGENGGCDVQNDLCAGTRSQA